MTQTDRPDAGDALAARQQVSHTKGVLDRLRNALQETVLGQGETIEALLGAFLAGGHVLLEGVPGVGKTLLARSFAACLGAGFRRIQFTPDLMPGDIIGANVFDQKSGEFRLVKGPIFTDFLMADEINRTPPKTQAALMEAMQEGQVTIDGARHPLVASFFVVATQNPVEFEGTYPLPEAQLDRFLMRIQMGLPSTEAEVEILRRAVSGTLEGWAGRSEARAVVSPEEAELLRQASRVIHVEADLLDYLAQLAAAVRRSPHLELGISPRGALALLETARAAALLVGRDYVVPDDLKRFLGHCWNHRILLTAESELEGHTADRILEEAANTVEIPR